MPHSDSTLPKPWHYIPLPGMHVTEAAEHAHKLADQLRPWCEKARQRLAAQQKPLPDTLADDAEVPAALSRALEWDGYQIAHELRLIAQWPVDFDLCARLQRWSVALKTQKIAAWKARQANTTPKPKRKAA